MRVHVHVWVYACVRPCVSVSVSVSVVMFVDILQVRSEARAVRDRARAALGNPAAPASSNTQQYRPRGIEAQEQSRLASVREFFCKALGDKEIRVAGIVSGMMIFPFFPRNMYGADRP